MEAPALPLTSYSEFPVTEPGLRLAWPCLSLPPLFSLAQCTRLGSHLSRLLGHYQQFQSGTDSLQAWMQACEAKVEKLLSDTVASDPGVLQQQLATTKVSQDTGCCTAWLTVPKSKANAGI